MRIFVTILIAAAVVGVVWWGWRALRSRPGATPGPAGTTGASDVAKAVDAPTTFGNLEASIKNNPAVLPARTGVIELPTEYIYGRAV
jgi:hypothetical protein